MPDLAAGSKVKALDFPVAVSNAQTGSYTFTNVAYGVATTGDTYVTCGVAFVAGTTGRVRIDFAAQLDHSTTGTCVVAPHVRTGGTVGSGTDVVVAADSDNIFNIGTDARRYGAHMFVSGLTAGSTYNVRLEHKTSAATATAANRIVTVSPAT